MLGSCWIKSFAATVQGFCGLIVSAGFFFFFTLNTRRNSDKHISLCFIFVFSRKNLDGKKPVLDKLPMQIS